MLSNSSRVLTCAGVLLAALSGVAAEDPPRSEETRTLVAVPAVPPPVATAPERVVPSADRIGRQDLLEIRVFDLEELNQTVRVQGDGSITLPLLGRIEAAGRTQTELEQLIAELLEARFVRDPQVSVFIREYQSRRIAVSGTVKKPGSYEMLGRKTVLEMLSLAGGLDEDYGGEIIVFRLGPDGSTERLALDLERLVYDADPTLNIEVVPGDILYVPAIEKVRIFVTGAVRNPNLYEVPRTEPVTVLKAVTLAGGTTDRAAEKRVQVLRTDPDGRRVSLEVNLRQIMRGKAEDPILQADDVVLVPEAFF